MELKMKFQVDGLGASGLDRFGVLGSLINFVFRFCGFFLDLGRESVRS